MKCVIIFCFSQLTLFTAASIIFQAATGQELSPTLTQWFFTVWGVELGGGVLMKVTETITERMKKKAKKKKARRERDIMTIVNLMIGLATAALVLTAVILAVKGERGKVEEILFSYVIEAERQFGKGTGVLKKAHVIEWVHDSLPAWAKPFVTAQWIGDAIERVLERAWEEWKSSEALDKYIHS
ncbi:MAG: hypothetical protein FWF05_00045 [Oscillospiraceae bacterium]|nr:hypothetical protein [Oscillospiraceae bacterium]